MIRQNMQRNGALLAVFALISTLLIMVTAHFTAAPIAREQKRELLQVLRQLIPADMHDNELYQSCVMISDERLAAEPTEVYLATLDGVPQAAAMHVTAPNGYSGAIELLVAVQTNGTVAGVRVLKHQETPGLGDKIERRKSDWITTFNGMQVKSPSDDRWAVQRDGGAFDQFTGATITPRAVVQAVKRAVLTFNEKQTQWFAQTPNCEHLQEGM